MKCFEQVEVSHVADKDEPAGLHRVHGAAQHSRQVVESREVLDDGIQDHSVKVILWNSAEIVRALLQQLYVIRPGAQSLQPAAQVFERDRRKIGPPVLIRMRRNAEEQQPGSAAYFENPFWPARENRIHGRVSPLSHLAFVDRLARVAAIPAYYVELRIAAA